MGFSNKRHVLRSYIEIIKDIYEGAVTRVGITCGEIQEFPLTISFASQVIPKPYLFALIIDKLTARVQEEIMP